MSERLRISTAPDQFEVPAYWDGAVTRGDNLPVSLPASEWMPGDTVQCLIHVGGSLREVKFVVGQVEELPD